MWIIYRHAAVSLCLVLHVIVLHCLQLKSRLVQNSNCSEVLAFTFSSDLYSADVLQYIYLL